MKILHVLDHSKPYYSGYAFRSDYILRNQIKHGLDVLVVTSPKHKKSSVSCEEIKRVKYYRTFPSRFNSIFSIPFLRELIQISKMIKKIRKICKMEKVDLVHAHSPSLNGIAAYFAVKKLGIPIVYEVRAFWEDAAVCHGTFKPNSIRYHLSKIIETKLYSRVNRVFTICESMKRDIVERGFPDEKITVIPNGVDAAKFLPSEPDDDIKLKLSLKGKIILGYIGSFYKYEGLEDLISMMKILKNERSDVKLLLIGDGPEYRKINKLISSNKLSDFIVLTGKIPHNAILKYYSVIDIFIYPRKKTRLTELVTPLKPLEAMAMGKIVIGSDVGGIRELIDHENTGIIYHSGEIMELKNNIIKILNNKTDTEKLRKNARDYVEKNRDWFKITESYIDAYRLLV